MDLLLKGKNVAIAGATRGIGRAMAEQFAAEGCNVSICARNKTDVEKVCEEITQKYGVKVIGSSVDATDRVAQSAWIDETADTLGGLDVFVANVSALNQGTDEAAWQQSYEVDMMATFHGAEAATPHLKAAGGGALVFISSVAALHVPGGPKPYGAMKAAVINYAKGLARALAPDNIRVNCVSPGNIYFEDGVWGKTERNNPEFFQKQVASNPMGRMGSPDEVAAAAVFLACPAASFISGTNLVVDGALTLGVQY